MRAVATNLVWEPLPAPFDEVFQFVVLYKLERWLGTRYRSGERLRGVFADCIGFGCGALDDVDGRYRAASAPLPADSALHNPEGATIAIHFLRELYSPSKRILQHEGLFHAQPMDILIAASGAGGPGHMMLIGPEPNTLWHCTQTSGVHKTGWSLLTGFERVFALYRLSDRERWLL
jgi:hypothetical protein